MFRVDHIIENLLNKLIQARLVQTPRREFSDNNEWPKGVPRWAPPKGFFKQPPSKIAHTLKAVFKDTETAGLVLNYFRNYEDSHGDLTLADGDRFDRVWQILQLLSGDGG